MWMALQKCLSGGRRILMTNYPISSTYIRHLFWPGMPEKPQKWLSKKANHVLNINAHKNSSISSTKWLSTKTYSQDHSQVHRGRSGRESSETTKDDDASGDDDDDDDDDFDDNDDEDNDKEDDIDKEKIESQIRDIFTNKKEMSSVEWKNAIELLALCNRIPTEGSCDWRTMMICQSHGNYHLGTSYLHYLEQEGREPNLSTLGSYLQLCGEHVEQCGEARVLEYYHKLLSRTKVLDATLLKNVIVGLSATREWRHALDLLPRYEKLSKAFSVVYSAIITAAFRAGDYDLAWQLFDTLRQLGQNPKDAVILEWIRLCEAVEDRAQKEAKLLTLFHKLEATETFPSVAVVRELTRFCREGFGWSAHYLKMPRSGRCPACKHQMEIKGVTEVEFRQLQKEFVPRVLKGSDIFNSTDPKEWRDFQSFVKKRQPFSVVVDGLNASYVVGRNAFSRHKALEEVVKQSLSLHGDSRVLILSRQHVRKWLSRGTWDPERVSIYILNNMSKDDGFFLYAALQSGLGTKFITSDMLRDHLYRLGENHLRDIFKRWQRTHQVMVVSMGGHPRLMMPPKFSTITQHHQLGEQEADKEHQAQQHPLSKSQSRALTSYHIPYDDGQPRQSYEVPTTWLCLHPTLTLSPPLPAYVSLEPITSNTFSWPDSPPSPHNSDTMQSFLRRHQHRAISPMNGNLRAASGDGVFDDRDQYKNFANKRGQPQRRQNSRWVDDREDGLGGKSSFRFKVNDDGASPRPPHYSSSPSKNRKRFAAAQNSTRKINLSTIFYKDEE